MADDIEVRKQRFLTLQKRLKEERQFVKHEKEQLRKLNEKITLVSQNLYYLEWKNRKQWMNIDRLVFGKSNPSECSDTAKLIESIAFEDAGSHLNYQDSQYGKFLLTLRDNPKLVACILDYCDTKQRFQTTTRHLCRLMISTLYGSCAEKRDELSVLQILNELMELQVLECEDLLQFFCGKRSTQNAFASIFTVFSEMLFSSKLYLTAALHGTVMQVIVDDAIFLDVDISNVVSRIPARIAREKFGEPGTTEARQKMDQHMAVLHNHIISLCEKFLKSLYDKIYCFPQSLRWAIANLYNGMLTKLKLPPANAKALIGYMLMTYFICPAIINPEPYGINSDADISETARHNLGQVASILRSLALLECGLKDEKFKIILDRLEQGKMMNYISHLLKGVTNIAIIEPENLPEMSRCSLLITEHDLKCLVKCLKLIQSCNVKSLNDEGLDELLELLPPMPRRWMNENSNGGRDIRSMPPNGNINDCAPIPPPRHNKIKKAISTGGDSAYLPLGREYVDQLKLDLSTMVTNKDVVLIIPLGNESDQHAGMLSEDKVLGVTSKLPTSNSFDMDTMENDLNKRTHSIMMDALRESIPDANLLDLSNENLDAISSSSVSSAANEEFLSIKSKEQSEKEPDPLESVNIWSNEDQSPDPGTLKANTSNVPVDNLINFGDGEPSVPKLPEKKGHYERVSSAFNDEPLIDLAINDNQNQRPTSQDMNRQTSTVSLIGGSGGLNAILQNAMVPSPTTVKNSEFQNPWSPLEKKEDPWGSSDVISEKDETPAFENDFQVPSPEKGQSRSSSRVGSVESNYAEYAERVKKSPGLKKKFGIDLSFSMKDDDKTPRKKSQGAWLKDKLSTIRLRTGNSGSQIKKNTGNSSQGVQGGSETPPLSPRGTPKEASARSKEKSLSLISTVSSEDASEDIMEKYRKMATLTSSTLDHPSLHTLPSSQMEGALTQVYEDKVVFDDDFKFEDAKRKLRTVFCTADHANLPSDAQSFDQLLLTMLQAKLAEAINLQDRFAVAQLHETLRSIKQLTSGSCEKLIEKLESDYEERWKYVSYLIKSKQGLLSTISHLEQVTAKMQRDKVICSRYFTTLSVRLFLETMERKEDLLHFARSFTSTNLLDEKSALLTEFLAKMIQVMLKEPTWSHCTDEQLEDAQVATERALMSKIFRDAFYPNGLTDVSNDRIFHQHIESLAKTIKLSHPEIQIPKMYQKEAPWPSAQTELLMVNAYKTAADKLACIHRCCVTIMNLLSMASEKQTPGADDFLPVLVYVVIKANPPNMLSTKQYVNTFYENRLSGEQYYCWMQFCSSIEFIKTIKP